MKIVYDPNNQDEIIAMINVVPIILIRLLEKSKNIKDPVNVDNELLDSDN